MNTKVALRPVISAWSAVSPYGVGRAAFTEGIGSQRPVRGPVDPEVWDSPDAQACLVPGFSIRDVLGRKGTRSMDRATGLAVATVGRLFDDSGLAECDRGGEDAALVLGTTTGSAQSIMDFTRESITSEKPFFVDPARFPNTVMNCAAGQCAIWHQLQGPNATVAGGRVAGLHALNYGRRLLASGRARSVLAGAVEEYSHARAWLETRSRGGESVLGEGCAMIRLTQPDEIGSGTALAELLGVGFGVFSGDDPRAALTASLRRAVRTAGVDPGELRYWAPASSGSDEAAQREAVESATGSLDAIRVVRTDVLGDTGGASALFQLAAVLAVAADDPGARGQVALISSVDREGVAGCALLRLL
jgi:3-oxoacyl-[acyl-carrier-protein] synthase II